jgi:glycosyltransferase involved in cell wall biosynthesis
VKISICIPTWEQYGKGTDFLNHLLNTIVTQTYKNFNVIISDHSIDNNIENLCNSFKDKLEIFYIKNPNNRGNGPANTNNSIINADGDIIKIMFQDDFFYENNSLELIVKEFENNDCNWLVNGCNHTYTDGENFVNSMSPRWNDNIILGINTISSPSVLSFRKGINILFDEKLIMYMDCEMYYQLYLKFGLPKIIPNYLITNRLHEHQISSMYQKDANEEINYIKTKHKI